MKKFKSLFSLMLVMILMLSMAGPMAFADGPDGTEANPYTVTVTVNDPKYSPSQGKYIPDGCTVVNDQTGTTLTVVPTELLECTVSADSTTVTAFPSDGLAKGSTFKGSNGVNYKVSAANNATITKPVLTVTTDAVYYDAEKQQYTGSTANIEGLVGDDKVFCSFSTQTSGNSVTITPVDVLVKNGDYDVANRYFVNTTSKTFDKPTFSITLATPVYNAGTGKYDVSGAADSTVTTIKLAGGDSSVTPIFDVNNVVVSTVNGTATASLSPQHVTLKAGAVDVTAAFNISVNDSSLTKREIHIYPNAPVDGKANGYYALNKDGSYVTDYDVYATVYIENGVAKIDSSSVKIYLKGQTSPDFINSFDVKLHTASNDGAGSGNSGNSGNTNPTGVVIKTASNSWIYDGQPHSYAQFDPTTIPSGWTVSGGTFTNSITNVGTVANTVNTSTLVVKDASGNLVTDYTVEAGTLTITKRPLTIQATSAGKTPNGYAFSEKDAKGVKFANSTSLVSGHTIGEGLKIQYVLGSTTYTDYKQVTASGTYIKDLVTYSAKVVVDAYGNDMTSNYDITTIDGTLTISSGWVSPDTGDHSNMVLWIVLLAVSAVAVAAVVVVVLKKNKKA